jgi:hypothetical protein
MSGWQVILVEPAKAVLSQISQFVVNVVGVIVILIAGWLISKGIKTLVTRVLKTLKSDQLSESIGLENLLEKGGIASSFSELMGAICYWLALLVTIVVAINAVGLTVAATMLNNVVLYIPNVLAAIFILVLGMFIATFLKNLVQAAAINAGLSQAKLLAKTAEVVVMVFAIIIALEQLNIGAKIIELAISIVLGAIALAVAIAFGLGCKDIAGKAISDLIQKLKK